MIDYNSTINCLLCGEKLSEYHINSKYCLNCLPQNPKFRSLFFIENGLKFTYIWILFEVENIAIRFKSKDNNSQIGIISSLESKSWEPIFEINYTKEITKNNILYVATKFKNNYEKLMLLK